MQVDSFQFLERSGWTVPTFPDLDSEQTVVFVFGPERFADQGGPIAELANHFSNSLIVGCSTAGEIYDSLICDNTLSVSLVKFNQTKLRSITVPVENAETSYDSAKSAAEALMSDDLKAVFVISDGLFVNGSELVRGFNDVFEGKVSISGGLAGDNSSFVRTAIFDQGNAVSKCIKVVGFYGDKIKMGYSSKGGWDKFGHERVITHSKGNILYELDGKPALEVYKRYLGDKVAELPGSALLFPLGIHMSGQNRMIVRSILGIDEATQSLIFAGDITEGSVAQFLYGSSDRLIHAADEAISAADSDNDSRLAIAISCVGRRLVLGERTEEEVEAVREWLDQSAHLVGFYSYGEICLDETGTCDLHNQSMTITTFSEAA